MISNILDDIKKRKDYYRNKLHLIVKILISMLVVIILLIAVILYEFFTQPDPFYYATMSDGRLVQLLAVPRGTGLKDPRNS